MLAKFKCFTVVPDLESMILYIAFTKCPRFFYLGCFMCLFSLLLVKVEGVIGPVRQFAHFLVLSSGRTILIRPRIFLLITSCVESVVDAIQLAPPVCLSVWVCET